MRQLSVQELKVVVADLWRAKETQHGGDGSDSDTLAEVYPESK
jgi:hypothetical protein